MDTGLVIHIEVPKAVERELLSGLHARKALAVMRQQKINRENAAMRSRLMNGLGQLVARVDSDVYWQFVHKFGRGCWRNRAFLKDCIKQGAVVPVRGQSEKVMSLGILSRSATPQDKSRKQKALSGVRSSHGPSFPTAHLPLVGTTR